MPFCKNCGAETPEDELKSFSGLCRACHESLLEKSKEDFPYPKYYPRELKYLYERVPRNQHASFETTPVPSIKEIKRFSKYKIKINMGIKKGYLAIIVIILSLPFLFSFLFVHAIANSLAIDYSHALKNTYAEVTLYTNLMYYGIMGLCFLISGFGVILQGGDTEDILPVAICFFVIFIVIGVILGNILWDSLAPKLFSYLTS